MSVQSDKEYHKTYYKEVLKGRIAEYKNRVKELKFFNDFNNNVVVRFRSDAPQRFITALKFNGVWCIVKQIIEDWGYTVIECQNEN